MSAGHFEMALRSTGLKAAQSLSTPVRGAKVARPLSPSTTICHNVHRRRPRRATSTLLSRSDLFKYDRQRCCDGDGGGSNFTPSKDDDSARKVKRLKIARGTASLG